MSCSKCNLRIKVTEQYSHTYSVFLKTKLFLYLYDSDMKHISFVFKLNFAGLCWSIVVYVCTLINPYCFWSDGRKVINILSRKHFPFSWDLLSLHLHALHTIIFIYILVNLDTNQPSSFTYSNIPLFFPLCSLHFTLQVNQINWNGDVESKMGSGNEDERDAIS
jgi:hypothetical protein